MTTTPLLSDASLLKTEYLKSEVSSLEHVEIMSYAGKAARKEETSSDRWGRSPKIMLNKQFTP